MGICFSNMLNLQPYESFWGRRLITDLPEGSETILYATEDVILSNMVHRIKNDPMCIYTPLKERMFVQWYLDECTMAYYKKYFRAPKIVDLFHELFELSGATRPPPPQDVELARDDFMTGTRRLAAVISWDEAERVFEIVDTDGGGSLSEEEFIIVFSGMGGTCAATQETDDETMSGLPKWMDGMSSKSPVVKAYKCGQKIKSKLPFVGESQNGPPKTNRKRDSIIAQHQATQKQIGRAKSSEDVAFNLQEVASAAKNAHHFSMREAMSKLHVILEGEEGYEKKMRSYRARRAAATIQKYIREKKARREADMRAQLAEQGLLQGVGDDAISVGQISTGPDVPEEWVDEDLSEHADISEHASNRSNEGKGNPQMALGNGKNGSSNANGSNGAEANGGDERVICESCRCVNPAGNARCGMCGEPMNSKA